MAINFPIIKKTKQSNISAKNRGMNLETIINESNEYYLNNNKAIIHKKPTPVQIVHVDYPSRNKAVITEAYYKTPSTTDYNGIYKGRYIDFEAKENNNKTLFPLKNVHDHQIHHLKQITDHGGIGFLIIYWNAYNEFYLMEFSIFYKYYLDSINGGRQSILYQTFKNEAHLIKEGYLPRLNYLAVIDEKIL